MSKKSKQTLIVVASNSSQSINLSVAKQLKEKLGCDLILATDFEAVIYSFDAEQEGFPESIVNYIKKLRSYQNLIFFIPEHNGYLPAFFKNIMDWASRGKYGMNFLKEQNAIIVCVTPGPLGGVSVRNSYSVSLGYTGAKVLGTIGIGNYQLNKDITLELNKIGALLN